MKKAFTSLTIAASAAALLAGCAADGTMTTTGRNTAIGAAVGAGLGTVVGNQVGDRDNRTRATGAHRRLAGQGRSRPGSASACAVG